MVDRLKPCPFCGKTPDINDPDCIYPASRDKDLRGKFKHWNLNCFETGDGCAASILGSSKEDVIKKWNTRVSS